ncbi:death effector domain-containing 1 isoform X2 [Myripristis murdjan]|uniref:Death effector domain-containing 1 n=1 Tax=Myripristis murdjan TaxID=586833 RepID=A0A668AA00_9TELE|nr:DNA-binding death effector domain-containing protein 2 isoform X2 [Myripristis murdjan]
MMAHYPGYSLRDTLYWDETECLNYYGMLSLHEVFEIVSAQLTETDIDVLSFLLNESFSVSHPLDPAGWTVEPRLGDPDCPGVSPSPELLKAWKRLQPQGSPCSSFTLYKPSSGLELLLELERRGYISEGNLEPLLQLLRVLTRHDLLPFVSRKRRRTVSPERIGRKCGIENGELMCHSGQRHNCRQTEIPMRNFMQDWRSDVYPPMPGQVPRRRRKKRGHGWSRRPKKPCRQDQLPPPPPPEKVCCDIRLRVRAEYLEHDSVLRGGVSSDKQQPLERQFELFSRASSLLRARDLGSIICNIKFTELDNLEAFWGDYLSGALLEALKGVFITDSLRMAAGSEGVRLLISVDQDDYEEGRRVLLARRMRSSINGPAL